MSAQGPHNAVLHPSQMVVLDSGFLDALLPLHIRVRFPGTISHTGPTFAKLFAARKMSGENLFDVMTFTRPSGVENWGDLVNSFGAKIAVKLSGMPRHNLKAICVPLDSGSEVLLNFSLGAGVREIVASKHLKTGDFSPADPTGEMLYMMEVQSVLLDASRDLNNRLNGARALAEEQAETDPLTGLSNRRALRNFLTRLIERPTQPGFWLLQIDLDLFKNVNDTLGHAAGDHVLQQIARVLQSETRSTDMVARVGGDEFVIVLCDHGALGDLKKFAHRIIRKIREPIHFGPHTCQVGASIGAVLQAESNGLSADDLIHHADTALYVSKKKGGGSFSLATAD